MKNIEKKILFNKYFIEKKDLVEFKKCLDAKKISSNNFYQKKCQNFIRKEFGFKRNFITHSCTSALEASALIMGIKKGDEVIVPSYSFVTTASVFANFGAKIQFLDNELKTLNITFENIKKKVTKKTKAIVVMHYAGVSKDISKIKKLCKKKKIYLVEDAAQCIGSKYKNKYLGSYGDFSTFSFHETKNISCGEGGLLVINNKNLYEKSKIVCLKGTNRMNFEENKTNFYTWIGKGFSALASDITCSILYNQLKKYKKKNKIRKNLWLKYHTIISKFKSKNLFITPDKNLFKYSNYHLFYLLFYSKLKRDSFIKFMEKKNIRCVFHYLPLHKSPASKKYAINYRENLKNSEFTSSNIVRLPLHNHLTQIEQNRILKYLSIFIKKNENS